MQKEITLSKLKIAAAMLIFGTIGVFREATPLPSELIAIFRGIIGALFLVIIRGKRINLNDIKHNLSYLLISGTALGLNWLLLFEAYSYTSISAATLYYYMAPVIIIVISPLILREKFHPRDLVLVLISLLGIALVSGALGGETSQFSFKGLIFGISAAFFYATIVITNKKLKNISSLDRTISQLIISAIVLIPYFLIKGNSSPLVFDSKSIVLCIIMGILHTGIAYVLYFGAIEKVSAKTAAILSYIDPVFAITISSVLSLKMPSIYVISGAILILGSSLISELYKN